MSHVHTRLELAFLIRLDRAKVENAFHPWLNAAMSKTLFEKIIARDIPAAIVYEDDLVLAIRDINPQAPTHVLIFPKEVIPRIAEAKTGDQGVLGHLLLKAAEVAGKLDLTKDGFRLVINNG